MRKNTWSLTCVLLLIAVAAVCFVLGSNQPDPAPPPAIRIETVKIIDKTTGQPITQEDYDYLQKDIEGMRESYDLTLADYRNLKAIAAAIRDDWKTNRFDAQTAKHRKDLGLLLDALDEHDAEPFQYPEFDEKGKVIYAMPILRTH